MSDSRGKVFSWNEKTLRALDADIVGISAD